MSFRAAAGSKEGLGVGEPAGARWVKHHITTSHGLVQSWERAPSMSPDTWVWFDKHPSLSPAIPELTMGTQTCTCPLRLIAHWKERCGGAQSKGGEEGGRSHPF